MVSILLLIIIVGGCTLGWNKKHYLSILYLMLSVGSTGSTDSITCIVCAWILSEVLLDIQPHI